MRDDNCIFCKIANGEIPSTAVYEDENFKAILDLGPAQKGHTLILPQDHYKDLTEAPEELCGKAFALAGKIGAAMKKGLGCAGFNVVQNNGSAAGQTVFHLHVHIIPRYADGPQIVAWNPGTTTPEESTETAAKIAAEL